MENLSKTLGQIKEAHNKVKAMHENCARLRASAESGAGAVKATVDGNKMLLSLDISAEYICPEDKQMLQDLVIASVNMANSAVEKLVETEVKQSTEKMLSELSLDDR